MRPVRRRARPDRTGRGRRTSAVAAAALVALVVAAGRASAAEPPIPPLTGPVVDTAGLLDAGARQRLEALARAARAQEGGEGVQLQYLIIRSLDGAPIEDYAIRVAEAWKIGSRGRDNGVLVVVAVEDRAVRIEVGGGIEGGLTDAQSGRIIRGTIAPMFREGRYGEGLYQAGLQILSALGALPQGLSVPPRQRVPGGSLSTIFIVGVFILIFFLRILSGFGPRRRRSLWGMGPWMGGGGWGGGGGGGSWGGGGGGFSGGGASGRW